MSWHKEFNDYLQGFCKTYRVLPEVAITHAMVNNVKKYYMERARDEANKIHSNDNNTNICNASFSDGASGGGDIVEEAWDK